MEITGGNKSCILVFISYLIPVFAIVMQLLITFNYFLISFFKI